jgi:hypothetical protein
MTEDYDGVILKTLWLDMAQVFMNITKDSIINEKGHPDKLGELSDQDIIELTKWSEFKNCFTTEVPIIAWDCIRPMIKEFISGYPNPKQQRGAYMKMRYSIPEVYFTIIKKQIPEYLVYSNFITIDGEFYYRT